MAEKTIERRRVKVSVTVDPSMLQAVNAYVDEHPELDRSKVVNQALQLWYTEQQQEAMERQFAPPESAEERVEREAWRKVRRAAAERIFRRR